MSSIRFSITVTPDQLREIRGLPVTPAHLAYRMGQGPHLFRTGGSSAPSGGWMVLDCRDFDGLGRPGPFCQEVIRECAARNFTGVVCDFEAGRLPPLEETVAQLGKECKRRNWALLVPEHYASCSPHTQVMISSALSGGSLELRLEEAQQRFGRERVVLALQRTAEDFFLPSPTGSGRPLTQHQLHQLMEERSPSVFFSRELCARYFTYMSRDSGAHFVLFDDAQTMAKKVEIARQLSIPTILGAWSDLQDAIPALGLSSSFPSCSQILR